MSNTFWQNKKVFITGVNGFIGSNLTKSLLEHGAEVIGLERNVNSSSLLYFEGLDRRTEIVRGDLCDLAFLERVVAEGDIEVCFHLAAQVEVGVGLASPYTTFETNIRGTYSLLETFRRAKRPLSAIVVASTDKAYGEYPASMMPYREDYPLKPRFPYDTSKACADMIAQSYASELYRLPIVVTRFCNIYGPGQMNFSALIPDAIRSALGHSTFIPRGNGSNVRDFIFVQDVVDLYMRIAEQLNERPDQFAGHIYNAGTNEPRSVKDVLEKVFTIMDRKHLLAQVFEMMKGSATTGEIDVQYMDFDKVLADFGWSPRTSFDDGLKKTIDWFTRYFSVDK